MKIVRRRFSIKTHKTSNPSCTVSLLVPRPPTQPSGCRHWSTASRQFADFLAWYRRHWTGWTQTTAETNTCSRLLIRRHIRNYVYGVPCTN